MSDETKMPDEVWVSPKSWLAHTESPPPNATLYRRADPLPDEVREAMGRVEQYLSGDDAYVESIADDDLRTILDHLKETNDG